MPDDRATEPSAEAMAFAKENTYYAAQEDWQRNALALDAFAAWAARAFANERDDARGERDAYMASCSAACRDRDEARAEIAGLREALAAHQDELGIAGLAEQLAGAKTEIARLQRLLVAGHDMYQEEIARRQAPPGSTAMERAAALLRDIWSTSVGNIGNVRAYKPDDLKAAVAHAIEQVEAAARAQAVDEAARYIAEWFGEGHKHTNRIRALAAKPQEVGP